MSHARRYHEPGVGSRTGMRIAEDALNLDDFFQAGRRALIGSARSSVASSRRSSVTSVASTPSRMSTASVSVCDEKISRRESDASERARRQSKSMARQSGLDRSKSMGQMSSYASTVHSYRGDEIEEEMAPGCSTLVEEERSVLSERVNNTHTSARSRQSRRDTEYGGSDASSVADMQLYDDDDGEDDVVAFDGTAVSQSSRMSLASVAEEVDDSDESAAEVEQEQEDVEAESVVDSEAEATSIADDNHDAASLAASFADDEPEATSFAAHYIDGDEREAAAVASAYEEDDSGTEGEYGEASAAMSEEDSRHSAPENYSAAMSASEEESNGDFSEAEEETTIIAEQTMDDTTEDTGYGGYDDVDGEVSNDSASQNDASDDDVSSVSRSILSEKDDNVSVTGKKRANTTAKAKAKRSRAGDDDDLATPKARKRAVPGIVIDGRVVERIPSSHHRRDFAAAQQGGGDDDDGVGVRRGTRYRYKPLEYWRGEKARYGRMSLPKSKEQRRDDGEGANVGDDTIDADAFEDNVLAVPPPVIVLKEIIRIPRAEGEGTFAGLKLPRKRDPSDKPRAVRRAGSREVSASVEPDPTQPTRYAEEGWDKDTTTHARVLDSSTGEEREMQVACTSDQLRPRMAEGCSFGFEKVFVVEDFMATGVLFLLVDGEKPLKNSKDNYYTFTVLEGCVRVTLHDTQFTIAPQGMFFVPRGNEYSIRNISKRVARLAFTQAKRPKGDRATGRTLSSDPASG